MKRRRPTKKPPPGRTSPQFRRKVHDPKNSIANFHALNEGKFLPGEDSQTKGYRRGKVVKTDFVEASWNIVFVVALANAIAVSFVKIVIFAELGRPTFRTMAEDPNESQEDLGSQVNK